MLDLVYWPDAYAALDELAADPGMSAVLQAVERTLDRLRSDPFDRRLGTSVFQTMGYGGICATPIRIDDWYVFWQRSPEPGVLEVVLVHRLPVGQPGG
jgi:hypothetical protein